MQFLIIQVAGFTLITLATVFFTGWLKNLSIKNHWFDWPTHRGSHRDPIPNIGGLAMTVIVCSVILSLILLKKLTFSDAFIWLFLVSLLGTVGFLDDIKDLSTRLRILVHMIVAAAVVAVCGGINQLELGFTTLHFGAFSYLLGFIWVVGFINMYNFMDGINALAGTQALICGLIFAFWFQYFGQAGESLILLSVAAVSAGFLYWNVTPARVFMGDSGSTMLGGLFAIVCLKLHNELQLSIIFPALIFAWFLLDTSTTLIRRLFRGEKIWQAHRQHLYQKLAITPKDHLKVTGMISLLTIIISLITTVVLFRL
jgi:Fuc2NAc and GlcNAc transferase